MHQTMSGPEVAASLDDPAFAALVQNPVGATVYDWGRGGAYLEYAPLVNLNLVADRVRATGQFRTARPSEFSCLGVPPGVVRGRMIEFHHAGLDQYFYTALEGEIAALDTGALAGWSRTGHWFDVLLGGGCLHETDYQPAYRFWGKPGRGPSSHVFTTDREECAIAEQSGYWIYEASPFWALPPSIDGCPTYLVPLYRAWRSTGETRHRFSTDRSILQAMAKDGWIDEGARMCVEAGDRR